MPESKRCFAGRTNSFAVLAGSTHGQGFTPKNAGRTVRYREAGNGVPGRTSSWLRTLSQFPSRSRFAYVLEEAVLLSYVPMSSVPLPGLDRYLPTRPVRLL